MTSSIPTRPPSDHERKLKEKYAESLAGQSDLMDKLGQTLLTLELAIPGLYATVLKLVEGQTAVLTSNALLYLTFLCWSIALGLTLWGLFPVAWKVDPDILKKNPDNKSNIYGIEDFFYKSARRKRHIFVASSVIFWLGLIFAAFLIL